MNSKLLFAATIAVSLISTLAMANEAAPLTRTQVKAELDQAIANSTLQRTDYDTGSAVNVAPSTRTRADTVAALAADKASRKALVGPLANRTYNPVGTAILAHSDLTRAEVRSEVLQAAASGTLHRTDYDDQAPAARRAQQAVAPSKLAQRVKALFSRSEG